MRLRIIVEDDEGNVWAETSRIISEGVNEESKKVLIHPSEVEGGDLCYRVLCEAEDNINNWNNPKY